MKAVPICLVRQRLQKLSQGRLKWRIARKERKTMVKESNSERDDKVANLNEDFGAWEKNQKEKVEKK